MDELNSLYTIHFSVDVRVAILLLTLHAKIGTRFADDSEIKDSKLSIVSNFAFIKRLRIKVISISFFFILGLALIHPESRTNRIINSMSIIQFGSNFVSL